MADTSINVANRIANEAVPSQVTPVATAEVNGKRIQRVCFTRYPEVPEATSCDIHWDVNGNPDIFTYKDSGGTTVATKTITWVAGNPTNEAWT